jgi:hypothetical protein
MELTAGRASENARPTGNFTYVVYGLFGLWLAVVSNFCLRFVEQHE